MWSSRIKTKPAPRKSPPKPNAVHTSVDLSSAESIAAAAKFTVLEFGGIDAIVNTAAIFPVAGADGQLTEAQWNKTFLVNVTGNYLLARETGWIFRDQKLPAHWC